MPFSLALLACYVLSLSLAPSVIADTVFPTGKDAQLAEILGQESSLPGGCTWVGGSVDPRVAVSRYHCGSSSDFVLELRPPDDAVIPDARTEKFLIVRRSPAMPAVLFDALVARIRGREATWEWGQAEQAGHPNPPRELWWGYLTTGALVALLLVAPAWLLIARVRRGPPSHSGPEGAPHSGPPLAAPQPPRLPGRHELITWRAKVELAVGGIALGLAIAELVLQLALPSLHFHFTVARITDDRFTWRAGQAGDENGVRYVFDRDGFRTSSAVAASGARAILFVGDSFTQGLVNEDDTFPAVTCEALRRGGGYCPLFKCRRDRLWHRARVAVAAKTPPAR